MRRPTTIDRSNRWLIAEFLKNAGDSLRNFRYFSKRPLSVLDNHVVTLVFLDQDQPICYGHLDREGDRVWLGIAVIEKEIGKGWGRHMMDQLIDRARISDLGKIFLAVDRDNRRARSLYESFGFEKTEEHASYAVYELDLKAAL